MGSSFFDQPTWKNPGKSSIKPLKVSPTFVSCVARTTIATSLGLKGFSTPRLYLSRTLKLTCSWKPYMFTTNVRFFIFFSQKKKHTSCCGLCCRSLSPPLVMPTIISARLLFGTTPIGTSKASSVTPSTILIGIRTTLTVTGTAAAEPLTYLGDPRTTGTIITEGAASSAGTNRKARGRGARASQWFAERAPRVRQCRSPSANKETPKRSPPPFHRCTALSR